jgi:hypothetical protein
MMTGAGSSAAAPSALQSEDARSEDARSEDAGCEGAESVDARREWRVLPNNDFNIPHCAGLASTINDKLEVLDAHYVDRVLLQGGQGRRTWRPHASVALSATLEASATWHNTGMASSGVPMYPNPAAAKERQVKGAARVRDLEEQVAAQQAQQAQQQQQQQHTLVADVAVQGSCRVSTLSFPLMGRKYVASGAPRPDASVAHRVHRHDLHHRLVARSWK